MLKWTEVIGYLIYEAPLEVVIFFLNFELALHLEEKEQCRELNTSIDVIPCEVHGQKKASDSENAFAGPMRGSYYLISLRAHHCA